MLNTGVKITEATNSS